MLCCGFLLSFYFTLFISFFFDVEDRTKRVNRVRDILLAFSPTFCQPKKRSDSYIFFLWVSKMSRAAWGKTNLLQTVILLAAQRERETVLFA
jgi:hypothetical protein